MIDPGRGIDQIADILVRDGQIALVETNGTGAAPDGARVIQGAGLVASPGFIDIHCHLREPGWSTKRQSPPARRPLSGVGFTSVCAMPNTEPPSTTPPWSNLSVSAPCPERLPASSLSVA